MTRTPVWNSANRKTRSGNLGVRFPLAWLFLALVPLSPAGAAKPQLSVSAVGTSPRLYMVSEDEKTHWRLWGQYRQDFGSVVTVQAHFELGSENLRFQNSFRAHDMVARLTMGAHTVKVGRLSWWSTVIQARVDGGQYTVKTERFGSVSVLGGFPSVADFSDMGFGRKSFFLVSWAMGKPGKNFSVTGWGRHDGEQRTWYVGPTWDAFVWMKVRVSGALAWNLSDGGLHYVRLAASRTVGNHRVRVGVRNKRLPVSQPYPWVDGRAAVPAVVTVGVGSPVAKGVAWWNRLVYRMGDEPTSYLSSTLIAGGIRLAFLGGIQGERRLVGGEAGLNKTISSSLTSGVQMAVNAVDYGDLVDLRRAAGLYGWISWNPLKEVTVRLFGQINRNPAYDLDGRVGLAIHGTL